jgi:hypothetical protein
VNGARILTLDIETAPASAYVWGLWDQNIGLNQIIKPGRIICWAAKWLGESEVHYADERGGRREMFVKMHELLSAADAVVTYNGDKFDLKKLLGGFVEFRLPPPPPVASIDLLKTVKRFGLDSNKLDFASGYYKIGQKIKNEGMPLWVACMAGDPKAWDRMCRYNKGDVRLTERAYKRFRPYIKTHPYVGAGLVNACPACASANVQHRGYARSKAFITERMQCQSCGSWSQGARQSIRTVEKSAKLVEYLRA